MSNPEGSYHLLSPASQRVNWNDEDNKRWLQTLQILEGLDISVEEDISSRRLCEEGGNAGNRDIM